MNKPSFARLLIKQSQIEIWNKQEVKLRHKYQHIYVIVKSYVLWSMKLELE